MFMRKDKHPVFRKEIVHWYDSNPACYLLIFMMFIVFLFGVAGISVSRENAEYHGYAWITILLVVMSVGIIVSTTTRLAKRYADRFSKTDTLN
jgi:uncharacterized membrane protein YhaH (DUF805 family)